MFRTVAHFHIRTYSLRSPSTRRSTRRNATFDATMQRVDSTKTNLRMFTFRVRGLCVFIVLFLDKNRQSPASQMDPKELSLQEIHSFMVRNGGKVTNHDLVKHFKRFLTNQATQGK